MRRDDYLALCAALLLALLVVLPFVFPPADDAETNLSIALAVAVALPLYLLPAIIARLRKHPYVAGIFLLNLLLGWTFLGWVGALVWACVAPRGG